LAFGQGPNHSASKFYPDSSDPAETLLRSAASHAKDGQWAEAIGIYQRIIDQYGDKVARLPREKGAADQGDEYVLYVDLRGYCHRSLAKLPAEARAIYRNRVDSMAERWYREGQIQRDSAPLRRIVELAFCSSFGDDALELLGDIAFQEGRFGEALGMYRQLVLDRPDDNFSLVHPDPSVDLARVAAKKLLCRIAAGEKLAAGVEIEAFSKRFAGAGGSLAGRKGLYATILADSIRADNLAPTSQPDGRWPTFAGAFSRTKTVADPIDVGSLQWKVPLERISPARNGYPYNGARTMAMSPASSPDRLLAYHPIVLGDQVIVCDGSRVLAFNLNDRPGAREGSGPLAIEPAWKHDPENSIPQAYKFNSGIPRYTLSAVGNRIYARMGAATPSPYLNMNRQGASLSSSLVALDWGAQGKLLWVQRASDLVLPNRAPDRKPSVSFEGTPVADDRNVYIAVTDRREQTATYVACFDADTGARRWMRYLGAATSEADNFMGGMGFGGMGFGGAVPGDYGHRLLSLEGPSLYYQTNLGAVVALEAESGLVRWVANYPRQDSARSGGSDRDLNPAIVSGGLVIVAPSDAPAIFAFDADSGHLVWKTDAIAEEVKLSHLLGVAKGRLVATGDRVLLFDVKDGKPVATWPDSGKSEGYGRGVLAGDRIYWPTRERIEVLDQGSGLRVEPPIKLMEIYRTTGGNLVAGDGYLIVAQSDALVVFCQNSRLIDRYREDLVQHPDRASTHYRLARAAEAVGRDQLALESYEQASRKARSAEMVDGISLGDAARDHQFRLLTRLAESRRRDKKYTDALARLESAAQVARSDGDRLHARLLLAEIQLEAGHPGAAVDVLEVLLEDDRVRGLTVSSDDGHRAIRADLLIADRLSAIVKAAGRTIYESYDRRARDLFERAKKEEDPRLLEQLFRSFPVAESVPDALLTLAQIHQAAGRQTLAAQTYKRLLTLPSSPDIARARALWRLAQVYESQNYLVSARDVYLQIDARFPRVTLAELGPESRLADLVSARLARPSMAQIASDRPRPAVPLPLGRRWQVRSPNSRSLRVLAAAGLPPGLQSSRVFLIDGNRFSPLDPGTGQQRWTSDIGSPAGWVGYLSDKLLAANSEKLIAFDPTTGAAHWQYAGSGPPRALRGPDPFGRNDAHAAAESGRAPLHDFHLVGSRLLCLRGDQELIAFDGDAGTVDWLFSAKEGAINPKIWIGPERIVLHVQKPNQLLVLETETGRQVARAALPDGEGLERPPVPIDEDHVLIVPDRRTVRKFELSTGQVIWDYRESSELPVNGPPRVIVDAERLLVLHDGRVLLRLDPLDGSRRWFTVLGIEDLSDRLEAIACSGKRIFTVSQQRLRALSVDDGTALWSCHLTGPENALWCLALSEKCVLSYPSLPNLSDDEMESMPVVVRRQDTGALVQRFVFPATIADVKVRLDARGALVATSHALWALSRREAGGALDPTPLP
jgi:outer membrane protein assembly factor BamB/TolA-binding protein